MPDCVLCGAPTPLAVLCPDCLHRERELFLCALCGVRHLRQAQGATVVGPPRRPRHLQAVEAHQ